MVEEMCTSWANEVCANCGKGEGDNIKLSECTACHFVRYCSDTCEKKHLSKHRIMCKNPAVIYDDNNIIKNTTATEKAPENIRDDDLFRQPDESHLGECPICCLPLSIDLNKSVMNSCCCKRICNGCDYANKKQGQHPKCPYCREPLPRSKEEIDQNCEKRAKANDPVALLQMGVKRYKEGDYLGAFEYWTNSAELGEMDAHYNLSLLYHNGEVEKDIKKEVYHMEEAAIGGHPLARNNLGCYEGKNRRKDRAMKHFIIAAKLGYDVSLEVVKKGFQRGDASKEDFEGALRGHQAAVHATRSQQRDEAEKHSRKTY